MPGPESTIAKSASTIVDTKAGSGGAESTASTGTPDADRPLPSVGSSAPTPTSRTETGDGPRPTDAPRQTPIPATPTTTTKPIVIGGPDGLFVDKDGNLYVADPVGNRVLRRRPDGTLEVVAGTGREGYDGNGPPREVRLHPTAIVVDGDGIHIADNGNQVIRRIEPDESAIFLEAGVPEQKAFNGDGEALQTHINPFGLALAPDGTIYFSDFENHRVRALKKGDVRTVAGQTVDGKAVAGYDGEGRATERRLNGPAGIAVDSQGVLYIADRANGRIRRVSVEGEMTTTAEGLRQPNGVAVAGDGTVYVAEFAAGRVCRIVANGDCDDVVTGLDKPSSLALSGDGKRLYVSEFIGRRVVVVDLGQENARPETVLGRPR